MLGAYPIVNYKVIVNKFKFIVFEKKNRVLKFKFKFGAFTLKQMGKSLKFEGHIN